MLVGTSRNGERRPPVTLPKASSTGWPFCTTIGSACGGAIPESTHSSRFRRNASKKMWLGNRLRGPSLQFMGGGVRPALMMSDGRGGIEELVGRGVARARHLVVAEWIGRRVAVWPARGNAAQVVRLRHHVNDRNADVGELPPWIAHGRGRFALIDGVQAGEGSSGDGDDVAVVTSTSRRPERRAVEFR